PDVEDGGEFHHIDFEWDGNDAEDDGAVDDSDPEFDDDELEESAAAIANSILDLVSSVTQAGEKEAKKCKADRGASASHSI
ncbi:MAG: hypothetical protein Q9174_007553, partial [Haloplaca sp. 1 TL-2023]